MAKFIERFPVLNFSGGIRRDKSSFELQLNELLDGRNIELDERGRVRGRRGSQQFGNTLTGNIENSTFVVPATGSGLESHFLVNNNSTTSVVSKLIGTRLTSAVSTSDTTINVVSTTNFASSGTIEIDGDQISYTGVTASTFTGVTGITTAHISESAVHQWTTITQSGTAMDGRSGISYGVLNGITFLVGRGGNMKQYALSTSTISDVSSEPASVLLENYRDRLFTAGDGSGGTNSSTIRTSFSNRGDGTTWTTASDFFDAEDQGGEAITAYKVLNDNLGIFKTNSIFVYDEIELKQRVFGIGAYSQKVVQPLNDLLFTFCPKGIFQTNLFAAKQIGEPVRQYWENFVPEYDELGRTCTNTFAWTFQDRYFLFIGDIVNPVSDLSNIANDVVLEYNTTTGAWTIHANGYTDFRHAISLGAFRFGNVNSVGRQGVFCGDNNGNMWRLYERRYLSAGEVDLTKNENIYVDLRSNTEFPISSFIEIGLYDFTQPHLWKSIKHLRVYTEQGQWNIEFRVENEKGVGPYRPLGTTSGTNSVLPLPAEAAGYRIGLRLSSTSTTLTSILNGFVFEQIQLTVRPA